ncbi:uncharacterized protein MICPUCDRAFT_59211 [Micromonas pusilla CCMP1545]|uniref:Predicted protein n=1 Tax=Micromonas pusilla (strain CCMP1545) TaxID=564608 RepID=C1MWQ4_MICPC|nr:uncharacterized protein MICPUCDRAFT_59211 [Micromonas pusilla CCMP1545]EEH55620.1 predicted protein [Micromonas pusilla CCMP1545]|eukprot:XP_003059668.1 predicted protein [Micromonas pusilla CCMP1545]
MGLGREIRPGSRGLEWAASHGVPRVAFVGDCALSVLCFASACAVAGLRSGVGELGRVLDISRRSPINYCDNAGGRWCAQMDAGAVFAFLTAISVVPSAVANSMNSCGPW